MSYSKLPTSDNRMCARDVIIDRRFRDISTVPMYVRIVWDPVIFHINTLESQISI